MLDSFKLCMHITRRNWIVYKKDLAANISPTVADPALVLVSLGLGLGSFITNVEGMTYMQFLAPGLTVATALFTSFFESSYGFYVRMTFENVYKCHADNSDWCKRSCYRRIDLGRHLKVLSWPLAWQ